jgi:hypothetical protein
MVVLLLRQADNRNGVGPKCNYDPLPRVVFAASSDKADEKKGVSRETPFSFSGYVRDQSLNRPRTPTRLPPPRFSLP